MSEVLNIRAHHFLCLPGYQGNGYDGAHKTSWDTVSQQLKEHPDTFVRIVDGQDDLCKNCPNAQGKNGIKCNMGFLAQLDEKVKDMFGFKTGMVMTWEAIMEKVRSVMNKDNHKELCGNCEWRRAGLCEDTFEKKKAA
ncbi:MAG: DUF1284 domain-containing protein [Candidatus Gastranaerophilales bacterium]|nr:DUF1284 domain-containing protein [Candidatus Gastranaerophilales bacterium]